MRQSASEWLSAAHGYNHEQIRVTSRAHGWPNRSAHSALILLLDLEDLTSSMKRTSACLSTYAAHVSITDRVGSAHTSSAAVTYTVQDTTAPSAPLSLIAKANQRQNQIQLSWTSASDNVGVAGYRVSRNGTTIAATSSTNWIDTAYVGGATYTYSVSASDAAGNISAASNSVTITLSGGGGAKKK
jgi:fibronectin type 3 domain-containing protein